MPLPNKMIIKAQETRNNQFEVIREELKCCFSHGKVCRSHCGSLSLADVSASKDLLL